jgi:hypothetical protein
VWACDKCRRFHINNQGTMHQRLTTFDHKCSLRSLVVLKETRNFVSSG